MGAEVLTRITQIAQMDSGMTSDQGPRTTDQNLEKLNELF